MIQSADLSNIRRAALLQAAYRLYETQPDAPIAVQALASELDLHVAQLPALLNYLISDSFLETHGSGSFVLTDKGKLEAQSAGRRQGTKRILCIDTDPKTIRRLKAANYKVFPVSMGYQTGARDFSRPAPNEVDLMVCNLKNPACFDFSMWTRGNDNTKCKIVPIDEISDTFYVLNENQLRARHSMITEMQLGRPIPGIFGPNEVRKAIIEGGVPFLLFLNSEWIKRIYMFPNWFGVRWTFQRAQATRVVISPLLQTLLPEIEREIRFKLAIENRLEGPVIEKPTRFDSSTVDIVSNNIGEVFGQFLTMGAGNVLAIPSTHQNDDIIELLASRLDILRQPLLSVRSMEAPSAIVPDEAWNAERLNRVLGEIDAAIKGGQNERALTLAYTCLEGFYKAFLRRKEPQSVPPNEIIALSRLIRSYLKDSFENCPDEVLNLVNHTSYAVDKARNQFSESHFGEEPGLWLATYIRDIVNTQIRLLLHFY